MGYKKWNIVILLFSGIVLMIVGMFNYIIDPLWCFTHSNSLNRIQAIVDERQQKTNKIIYQYFEADTLVLGASTTSYINQNDFMGMKAFNYAVNRMEPEEYNRYIEFAKARNHKDFKYIIIGLDFIQALKRENKTRVPDFTYFENNEDYFYRYKSIFSFDTLTYSLRCVNMLQKTEQQHYDRNNVKYVGNLSEEKLQLARNINLKRMQKIYKTATYNNDLRQIFLELRENNPNTTFIVFTTPFQQIHIELILRERLDDYLRWLHEIVEVFGGVYHFTYVNSVTSKEQNYFDVSHFKPAVGTLIAHKIVGQDQDNPDDFGVYITKENFDKEIPTLINKSNIVQN